MNTAFRLLLGILLLASGSACNDTQSLPERYQHAVDALRPGDHRHLQQAIEMEAELAAAAEKKGFPRGRSGWAIIERLELIQEDAGQERVSYLLDEGSTRPPIFCLAALRRDGSLDLGFGAPMYAPPGVQLHVMDGKVVKAKLMEWRRNAPVFRLSYEAPATDFLEIPMQVSRLALSTDDIRPAQILFGEVALESDWYYQEGKRQRLLVTYLFKTPVNAYASEQR